MFSGCTSLIWVPDLPATAIKNQCYGRMFKNCSSLKVSTEKTGNYTIPWRISGTNSATQWNLHTLLGTTGTFSGDPDLNTTYYLYKYDTTPPVISGITDGETYYGPVEVTVTEDNLKEVTLNGKVVSLKNGRFTVAPKKGPQKIVATDSFDNSTTVTITVNDKGDSEGTTTPESASTGDNSDLILIILLLLASGGGIMAITLFRRNKFRQ